MEQQDFEIDPFALDKEWVKQPLLFMRLSEECAVSATERDKAKSALDLVDAQLDSAIRRDPEAFGFPKVTETLVANCVLQQRQHKVAEEAYFELREKHAVLNNALTALEHKKKALESLVQLQQMSYYSNPKERTLQEVFLSEDEKARARKPVKQRPAG